jgi:hypothetical protein
MMARDASQHARRAPKRFSIPILHIQQTWDRSRVPTIFHGRFSLLALLQP